MITERQDQVDKENTIIFKKFNKLHLRLSKKSNHRDVMDLEFDLVDSEFLPKWIDCMLLSQQRQDPISEPWAFYNLNDQWSEQYTLDFLNDNIDACNRIHPGMFDKKIFDINDQDTLNYLHSVFELHHGQLDTWQDNPIFDVEQGNDLRQHLSHINQTIHRCEDLGGAPRLRVVYFDTPKTKTFTSEDYKLFTNSVDFGGVYTCYADVGKNLESLATDNDEHHHDFVPNTHYSTDFYVKFTNNNGVEKTNVYQNFYSKNKAYFDNLGYEDNDIRLTTGAIKLAQLVYDSEQDVLQQISKYDNIQSVQII